MGLESQIQNYLITLPPHQYLRGIVRGVDLIPFGVYPYVYTEADVKTAKIFRSGNSQAVRIPKDFQLEGDEVEILKKGASLVLRPKRKSWAVFIESLGKFTDDFMEGGRKQPRAQKREQAF